MPRRKPAQPINERRQEQRRYAPIDAAEPLPFDPYAQARATPVISTSLYETSALLYTRSECTFRFTPDEDNGCWHLVAKYRRGKWEGHYIYVRVMPSELELGMMLLLEKLRKVEWGHMRPTKDRAENFQ